MKTSALSLSYKICSTSQLEDVTLSVCPLDGEHAPLHDAQPPSSRSLPAVLKSAQQHGDTATAFKWRSGSVQHIWAVRGRAGQTLQMMHIHILKLLFGSQIKNLYIYLVQWLAPELHFDWLRRFAGMFVLCFYSFKFHLIFHVSSGCLHLCEYVCVCVFVLPSYWGPRWWSWSRGNQWRRRPDAHIRKLGEPETLQEPQMWFRNLFNHLDSSVREQNTSIEPQVEVKHTKRRNNKPRWVKRARKTDWRLIRANQKIHTQAVWGNFICWLVFSPQPQLISAKLSLPDQLLATHSSNSLCKYFNRSPEPCRFHEMFEWICRKFNLHDFVRG